MVIPIQRQGTPPSPISDQGRFYQLPLGVRRCGAWVVEVSLIVVSGAVPFGIGLYAQTHSPGSTPLNPVLVTTQEAIAQTLALPTEQQKQQVTPPANILWTAALVAPLLLGSWQLYRLGKTGQTLPKRWFGVKVVTPLGSPPGLGRVLMREGIGRWGLPVGSAFLLWRYTGFYPNLGVMALLAGLMLVGESAIALSDPRRRTLHDRLAKTLVLEASKTSTTARIGFPPAPPRWLMQTEATKQGSRRAEAQRTQFTPQSSRPDTQHLKSWRLGYFLLQYPVSAWLIVFFASLVGLWGSYVGVQIYTQTQANRRAAEQQKNDVFITLVKQLSSTSAATPAERKAAILTIGSTIKDDPRSLQLLTDLLSQEKQPAAIEAIQQVLVRIGSTALPDLQRLNQALSQELESHRYKANREEHGLIQQRLRATQAAITNILSLDGSQLEDVDLSRINLSRSSNSLAPFTLVLNNMDLSRMNFRGASLTGANLQGSRFWSAGDDKISGSLDDRVADLSGAELREANLTNAVLNDIPMEKTNLTYALLNQANLSKARLVGANLSSAKLIGANLQRAILENASLTGADLTEADFSGANLQAARLGRVSAVGMQLPFANLRASDWRGADLSGANLSRAKLQNADLSNTRLAGTNLRGAQLQNVSFRNADLSLADFQGANLAGADFQGSIFAVSKPVAPDEFVQTQPDISFSARVKGVDFSQAKNLDDKQLAYICAQGGRHPRCR